MAADIITLADAVVAELNAQASLWLPQPFTAARVYVPEVDIEQLASLTVLVAAKELERERLTRASDQTDLAVDVGVFQKVADTTPAVCDPLVLLCQQIADHFSQTLLAGGIGRPIKLENRPVYDPAALREKKTFRSLITLTYRFSR